MKNPAEVIWHNITKAIRFSEFKSYRIACLIVETDTQTSQEIMVQILSKYCRETGGEDGGDIFVSDQNMKKLLEKVKRKFPKTRLVKIDEYEFKYQ